MEEQERKSTYNAPLRVLVVEDSEDDYFLLMRQIRKAYTHVTSARVQTEDELRKEMTRGTWNLVISDNTLPGFNATEALRVVRTCNELIPFIIVSGTIGEEAAVKAMLAGANDYMLKENTARLLPAIERELGR